MKHSVSPVSPKSPISLVALMILFLLIGGLCSAAAAAEETRMFTDDLGRTVELPASVDKVIPSGHLALSVLIAYDPKYLASCGGGLPANADRYLPELATQGLPKTGAIFYSSGTVNYEEVMNLAELGADVFIDVGQKIDGAGEALDEFTRISGMPAVFISQNSLEEIPDSYQKIGEILGETERGCELYSYMKGWIDTFETGMQNASRPTAAFINVIDGNNFYLCGGYNKDKSLGYQTTALGTFADIIVAAQTNKGLGDIYGMEELLRIFSENEPQYVFIAGSPEHRYYWEFLENPSFAGLSAVKNGHVYEIPKDCPYIWTAQPFSGWGICGMIWIAHILYPETFNYNTKDMVQEFYQKILGYNLTDAEYDALVNVSVPASTPAPLPGVLAALGAVFTVFAARVRR